MKFWGVQLSNNDCYICIFIVLSPVSIRNIMVPVYYPWKARVRGLCRDVLVGCMSCFFGVPGLPLASKVVVCNFFLIIGSSFVVNGLPLSALAFLFAVLFVVCVRYDSRISSFISLLSCLL